MGLIDEKMEVKNLVTLSLLLEPFHTITKQQTKILFSPPCQIQRRLRTHYITAQQVVNSYQPTEHLRTVCTLGSSCRRLHEKYQQYIGPDSL